MSPVSIHELPAPRQLLASHPRKIAAHGDQAGCQQVLPAAVDVYVVAYLLSAAEQANLVRPQFLPVLCRCWLLPHPLLGWHAC